MDSSFRATALLAHNLGCGPSRGLMGSLIFSLYFFWVQVLRLLSPFLLS